MLHEAGIIRQECYLLNVWQEEVFKSRDDRIIFDKDGNKLFIGGRGFTDIGLELFGKTAELIKHSGANVIVPLGSPALFATFNDPRVSKWRGSILESGPFKRKLVPTYHPAFLLRGQYIHRYTVVHDLKRAKEESKSRARLLTPRNLYIDPIFPDVIAWLKDCLRHKRVATDIECLNNHVSCFSVAQSATECMCIPLIGRNGQDRWTVDQEVEIWSLYARLLSDPAITKVNQNILFDISFLFQQNHIRSRGKFDCTMIAQSLAYPDFPKGLDWICSIYTREPYYKDDGKLWSKPWVDMERFWRYNALDSAVALEAIDPLYEELRDQDLMETYRDTIALFDPLMYMMAHGIKVNIERLDETRTEAKALLEKRTLELREVAEWDFNPASPKQCQEYFYGTKGIKPYVSIKTGQPTTDDKAMARIVKRFNLPEARLVQEIRKLNKLISNYLEVRFDSDGRVRCSYNPRGTTTGRLSSSETVFGTGLNFTNLDPRFKDFLEADVA